MKREDVKKQIPGITDEQLQWLMDENGKDITAEKQKATALQTSLDEVTAQLNTAKEGLAKFDGVDVEDLKNQITTLNTRLSEQAAESSFNEKLNGAIRDAHGRSVKAIRSLLDVDALKGSKNQDADIKAALDALLQSSAWAFETAPGGTGVQVNTGTEHGAGGSGQQQDGVEAAFAAMNPTIKL